MTEENEILAGKKFPLDILIVIIFSIIGAVMAFALPDGNFLRTILGIPLLIFFPGYALVSALWPGKSLDNIERIALSFGLSIVLSAIVGMAMAYTIDLTLVSITMGLLVLIILLCVLTFFQRSKIPEDDLFNFQLSKAIPQMPDNKPEMFFVIMLAACLIASGITMGYLITRPASGESYSEFYLLDINSTTQNYPVNLSVNEVGQVIVSINCNEYHFTEYEILFGLEGAGDTGLTSTWDEPQVMNTPILTRRNVTLDHEGVFEDVCEFSFTAAGTYQIVWELEVNGQDTNYQVHLWVEVHI